MTFTYPESGSVVTFTAVPAGMVTPFPGAHIVVPVSAKVASRRYVASIAHKFPPDVRRAFEQGSGMFDFPPGSKDAA